MNSETIWDVVFRACAQQAREPDRNGGGIIGKTAAVIDALGLDADAPASTVRSLAAKRPTLHTVRFELDGGYSSAVVECPYDVDDVGRPCWPVDDDDAAPYCNYIEWVLAEGADLFGLVEFPAREVEVVWVGDAPQFVVVSP